MDSTNTALSRQEIIDEIIKIYIEVIGFFDDSEKQRLSESTNMAEDFNIDSDDLSLSIAEIYRHFSVSPTQSELDRTKTIGDMADLVIKHNGRASKPYTTYEPKSSCIQWMKTLAERVGFKS